MNARLESALIALGLRLGALAIEYLKQRLSTPDEPDAVTVTRNIMMGLRRTWPQRDEAELRKDAALAVRHYLRARGLEASDATVEALLSLVT